MIEKSLHRSAVFLLVSDVEQEHGHMSGSNRGSVLYAVPYADLPVNKPEQCFCSWKMNL